VLFALSAAAAWGSGDFTNGIAARRVGTFLAVFISYIVGLVVLTVVAVAVREAIPAPADLLWGALAGLLGMAGLGFLLRGFTSGRMGIVAPVSASLAAAIPVVFTAFTEGLPRALQMLGFALALAGIWLLSRPEPLRGRPAGLGWAILAGVGFGAFFTALDQVSEGAVFWPLVAGRMGCMGALIVFALVTRRPVAAPRSLLGIIALAGLLDVGGNLFFLLAIQTGRLDVATVLSSLYPAVTTLLAWLVAREQITRQQWVGVSAAVAAIVFITI
jgi:drug/metabolite transporter (DMT)-like permease